MNCSHHIWFRNEMKEISTHRNFISSIDNVFNTANWPSEHQTLPSAVPLIFIKVTVEGVHTWYDSSCPWFIEYYLVRCYYFSLFTISQQPPVGHGHLIIEGSPSYSDTPQLIRLILTSDQLSQRPLPDNTKHSQQTDINVPRWDSNPRSQQASGPRTTP